MEQLVVALQVLYDIDLGIDMEGLTGLSEAVASFAGVHISPHSPLIGSNAFSHESGIHVAAVMAQPDTYEPIPPAAVGNRRRYLFGKHSGRSAIRLKLEERGLIVDDTLVERILRKVKAQGEANGGVTEDVFWAIVENEK
jgi:isopropylmalate/homocitrate/citramalate synthase